MSLSAPFRGHGMICGNAPASWSDASNGRTLTYWHYRTDAPVTPSHPLGSARATRTALLRFRMNWDTFGNLGEFSGAVGVVLSLLLVARQMRLGMEQTRRNTRSLRAAAFNTMVENSIHLLEHVFRDPELADFLARAAEAPHRLTARERVRWDSYMTAAFRHFGNLLYQWETGAMEECGRPTATPSRTTCSPKPGWTGTSKTPNSSTSASRTKCARFLRNWRARRSRTQSLGRRKGAVLSSGPPPNRSLPWKEILADPLSAGLEDPPSRRCAVPTRS